MGHDDILPVSIEVLTVAVRLLFEYTGSGDNVRLSTTGRVLTRIDQIVGNQACGIGRRQGD